MAVPGQVDGRRAPRTHAARRRRHPWRPRPLRRRRPRRDPLGAHQAATARSHAHVRREGDVLVDGLPWGARRSRLPFATPRARARGSSRPTAASDSTSSRCSSPPTARSPRSATTRGGCGRTSSSAESTGWTERGWEGSVLAAGDAAVALADLRGRCIVTTWDPDTLVAGGRRPARIRAEFARHARAQRVGRPRRVRRGRRRRPRGAHIARSPGPRHGALVGSR